MGGVLAIIALVVLASLALLSLKRQRETVSLDKQAAEIRSHTGEAQRERSTDRRAAVRATPAEGMQSAPEPRDAGPGPAE
jgi:hypothetical protein